MVRTHLPVLHFSLLGLVLLEQVIQHLFQSFRIRLERREHFLYGAFNQNAVDHAEAFPVLWEGLEGFDDKPWKR